MYKRQALNCTEGEIAKTLSFLVEEKPILIVVSGDAKIDNSKYLSLIHIYKEVKDHMKSLIRLYGIPKSSVEFKNNLPSEVFIQKLVKEKEKRKQ